LLFSDLNSRLSIHSFTGETGLALVTAILAANHPLIADVATAWIIGVELVA
jgi:hypothetical protein